MSDSSGCSGWRPIVGAVLAGLVARMLHQPEVAPDRRPPPAVAPTPGAAEPAGGGWVAVGRPLGYATLRGQEACVGLEAVCAIAVMAKAPRPGQVKTRLQTVLDAPEAAAISAAFLQDVTANIQAAAQ